MTVRAFAALFVALICSLLVHRAHAVIFASDDFSSPTSGTGWAPGNSWEGLDGGIVTTNPDGNSNVQSFRDFATPLDATNQTTYLRFDYAQTVPGDGNSYGGVSFFEGVEGSAGFEAFFAGNASGPNTNSLDIKGEGDGVGDLESRVPVDGQFHTLVVGIDTTGSNDIYKLWVDNFNLATPSASATVVGGNAIAAPWGTTRIAGQSGNTDLFDNLTIATTSQEVGLIANDATLTIDRSTGSASLSSASGTSDVIGYSLKSNGGVLNGDNWTPIADGNVDWSVTSQTAANLSESSSGAGENLNSTPLNFGTVWERSPIEDVDATIMIDDNGVPLPLAANVVYTGDAITPGDLDGNGDINVADWTAFKSGQGVVNGSMTSLEAYRLGDLDGNLNHDLADFNLFAEAYDTFNGAGSFDAMVQGVPEPGALALLGLGSLASCFFMRRRGSARPYFPHIAD